jgi:hypothetical protein
MFRGTVSVASKEAVLRAESEARVPLPPDSGGDLDEDFVSPDRAFSESRREVGHHVARYAVWSDRD